MALLEVKNLGISFGGLRAVNGFDISIEKEALYGLIGRTARERRLYSTFLQEYISRTAEKCCWTERILQGKHD